jgi:hypothetical protein
MTVSEGVSRSGRLRETMVARDRQALEEMLARDVVLHSPILSSAFTGRDAVAELLLVVHASIDDYRAVREIEDGDIEVAFMSGRVEGEALEAVVVTEFDENLASEIRVFFRPLRASAAFMNKAGPALATNPRRARFLRAVSPSLRGMAAATDLMAKRFIRLR